MYITGIANDIIVDISSIVNTSSMIGLFRVKKLISYRPFYQTLLRKGITEYNLIYKQGIDANLIHRMKHGKPITTTTLNTLCEILNCRVEEVLEYVPDEE